MSKTNNFIFTALKIISWVIFVGLCIEAGGLIVNFFMSLYKPALLKNLYQKLDLSAIYYSNKLVFFNIYSLIIFVALAKAYLFYIVTKLASTITIEKPFTNVVSKHILNISYWTFAIGIFSYIANQTTKYLSKKGFDMQHVATFWVDSEAFILMAAVIYIIAVIFREGIKIQTENELTV